MMSDKEMLYEYIKEKKNVSIMKVMDGAFSLFSKNALLYIMFFVLIIILSLFSLVFSLVSPILMVLLLFVLTFAVVPLVQVGYARFAQKASQGNAVSMSDFFDGFRHNLGNLILQAFLVMVITVGVTILSNLAYYQDYYYMILEVTDEVQAGGEYDDVMLIVNDFLEKYSGFNMKSSLGSLFSFYIGVVFSLTPYIVSFFKVNAFTAMDLSVRVVNKYVFRIVGLRVLFGVFIIIGLLFFLVGVIAAMPIVLIAMYVLFENIFGEALRKEEGGIQSSGLTN